MIFKSDRFYTSLLVSCFLAVIAIIAFPLLDKTLNVHSQQPGLLTFTGVGITCALLTAASIYFGLRSNIGLPKMFLIYVIMYNVLIVITKFMLSPWILYDVNTFTDFNGGWGMLSSSGTISPIIILTVCFVFLLYFLVFLFLRSIHFRTLYKALPNTQVVKTLGVKKAAGFKIINVIALISIILFMFLMGGWVLLIVIPAFEYFTYLLMSVSSLFIALALIGALLFVNEAFKSITERAIFLRDAAVLTSFFWVGIAYLALFHGLWIVYMLVIAAIWPFKVITPK